MSIIFVLFPLSECDESALLVLMDGVDEFYKSFLEKVNAVVTNENKDLNVNIKFIIAAFEYI